LTNPSTYLNVTNIVLGLVAAISSAVALGAVRKLAATPKKRSAPSGADSEISDVVTSFGDGHLRSVTNRALPEQLTRIGVGYTFHVPGLGLTMADGGEPIGAKEEER